MFSDYNGIILERNNRKIFRKPPNIQKHGSKKKLKRKSESIFNWREMKTQNIKPLIGIYQCFWDTVKAVL